MITADEMVDIIIARKLQVLPIRDSSTGRTKWTARTIDGSRAAPDNRQYDTPIEAVEVANNYFTEAEARIKNNYGEKLLDLLVNGEFFIQPLEVKSKEGSSRTFDVVSISSGKPISRDHKSINDVLDAVEDSRKLDRP